MANFVYADIYVSGTVEELKKFIAKYFEKNEDDRYYTFDFNKIMPIPKNVEDPDKWMVENWWTTGNPEEVYVDNIENNWLHVSFKTRWAFPVPVYLRLVEDNPELTFVIGANEETGDFIIKAVDKKIEECYRNEFIEMYVD